MKKDKEADTIKKIVICICLCLAVLCSPVLPLHASESAAAATSEAVYTSAVDSTEITDEPPLLIADDNVETATIDPETFEKHVLLFTAGFLILGLLLLLGMSIYKRRKIQKEFENYRELTKTFMDTIDSLVTLKDEDLKYVFVNRAFEEFEGKKADQIIGLDDFAMTDPKLAALRRKTDLAALEEGTVSINEVPWRNIIFRTTKFPVRMLNGQIGVGAYIQDVTQDRKLQRGLEQALSRHKILSEVVSQSFKSRQEQLDYVLHEALSLTESTYGFIFLYSEDKQVFTLSSWTKGVMKDCESITELTITELASTGLWGEPVRQRKPIVLNDFETPNPLRKGFPEGHVMLKRFMGVPVLFDGQIVALIGLANKPADYDDNDVYEMTLLMNGVWNAVERREAQINLSLERNKYYQTLLSIGDGVMVVDKSGIIIMLNHVAQTLTGWGDEAIGMHYKDVWKLSNEDPALTIFDPIEGAISTDSIQTLGNHAMLTSKDGMQYYLEDSAAPIKDDSGETVGIVLVFRDVTDKKEQKRKIEYLSFHDSLTGLYNRRFFEEEMLRLDTVRNLPLSLIMGDINGLKLTNDVFGHVCGDTLLTKAADVFRRVCRADDIIARWGGDEFVLLLPKTSRDEAEQILSRIKNEYAKEQIKAVKGSISMGCDTKLDLETEILKTLGNAEEAMYFSKSLEKGQISASAIENIIQTLHGNNPREKEHSDFVSTMCQRMGNALHLSENEIRKLKDAGYLHDIGKVALPPEVLNKMQNLTPKDWNEVKKHPIIGYRILNSFDDTVDLAEDVLSHQERWDGTGYPKGLKGEEIPLFARIISIAENYERKLHDSENFKAMTKRQALGTIRSGAGTHFDPTLTNVFIKMLEYEISNEPA